MLSIYIKEIKSLFNSLIAYLVIGIFLTGIGLYVWVFSPNVFEVGEADMSLVFEVTPYIFMFLIPVVTMRTFSEETKEGTLELLLTKPITEWQLVLGKYWASVTLVIIALLPTLIYFGSIYLLGNPVGNIDVARAIGSYSGLILLAFTYTAIGLWCSSLTDNQIVASISALFITLMLYEGLQYLGNLLPDGFVSFFIGEMSLSNHYRSLSIGVMDSRNILFLCSVAFLFLVLTRQRILARKW
jgi:ABC-2 type transport system permease protein